MVTDSETNFIYLADLLPIMYPDFYKRFEKLLKECDIETALLPDTKDVWAVDYMPIQIDKDKFVRFLYRPPYLTKDKILIKTISDVDSICATIGISNVKSPILVEGGNVTRCKNKVIMTQRVFKDNPTYERSPLIRELYELLQIEDLYFIPEQPYDFTGHSDGMVRFFDEQTLLINDYSKESKSFQKAFEIAIHKTGLEYIKIPYNVYGNKNNDQAKGDYINFLQVENTVIVPTFGLQDDDKVLGMFEKIFAGQSVKSIESNEIANEGGVLNCITWNIKK